MSFQQMKRTVSKWLTHGATLGAALYLWAPANAKNVALFGKNMSVVVAGFAVGVGASVIAEAINDFLLPRITKDKKWRSREAMLISIVASSAGVVGLFYIANPNSWKAFGPQLIALGAGAEIASEAGTKFINGEAF